MGKKIKIYETEIKRATRRKLMENYLDEEEDNQEMSGSFHRKDFKPSKREKDVMSVFGDMYGQDIPPVVIRYMRKNPDHVLRRLSKIYPEIYMRHAPVQPDYRDYPEPIDVSNQYDKGIPGFEGTMGALDDISIMDEATIEMSSDDFDKIKDMVGDETKDHTIKITESTKDLFKKFLNRK